MSPTGELRHQKPGIWPFLALALACAALLGLIDVVETFRALSLRGRAPELTTVRVLLEMRAWLVWGLVSPAVIVLLRKLDAHRVLSARNVLLHLSALAALHITSALLITLGDVLFFNVLPPDAVFGDVVLVRLQTQLRFSVLVYFAMAGAYIALERSAAVHARELHESQLQAQLKDTQLQVLRAQLQPHFLFNSLHSVSALMERDAHTARRMLVELSDLLRASLATDSRNEVPLEEELTLLRHYIMIQQMRFGERLSVRYDTASDALAMAVPRFLLQPLVENAIRHLPARHSGAAAIEIGARVHAGRLELRISDDGPGWPSRLTEGVGLSNTRLRLARLYGGEHELRLERSPLGGANVLIDLPAREAALTESAAT